MGFKYIHLCCLTFANNIEITKFLWMVTEVLRFLEIFCTMQCSSCSVAANIQYFCAI